MTASHTAEKPGRPEPKETKTRTLQAHVDARGSAWVGGEYTRGNAELTLRCARGHQSQTRARYILSGTWCPHCARQDSSKRRRVLERLRATIVAFGSWCPECANEARRVRKRRKRGKGVPTLPGPS